MPPRKLSAAEVQRASKRAKAHDTAIDSSEDEGPSPSLASKSALVIPTNNAKARPKTKDNTDYDDDDEDNHNMDIDNDDAEEDPDPTTSSKSSKKGKRKAVESGVCSIFQLVHSLMAPLEPRKISNPSDVFNRTFFDALQPATNKYYNKKANLIRLPCAEYFREGEITETCDAHIQKRIDFLLLLVEVQAQKTGETYLKYMRAMADDAARDILNVKSELKQTEARIHQYQLDTEQMRYRLKELEKEVEQVESRVEE